MKTCFKCGEEKELSEFYKHSQMKDGHLNKCKDCARCDTIENRDKNLEYYRKYDKYRSRLPHRVEARKKYSKTEKGKAAHNKACRKWDNANPEKRKAHHKINNSVRNKKISKPETCEKCGRFGRLEGHHEDYNKPLDVIWLCPQCHAKTKNFNLK